MKQLSSAPKAELLHKQTSMEAVNPGAQQLQVGLVAALCQKFGSTSGTDKEPLEVSVRGSRTLPQVGRQQILTLDGHPLLSCPIANPQ